MRFIKTAYLKFSPNPVASGERLFFESQKSISDKEYTFSLYDLSGEKVMQQQLLPEQRWLYHNCHRAFIRYPCAMANNNWSTARSC
ncbi:MAG TPA: hypothetical protein VFL76_00410 [Edaphocola sp.]|nr:hypothetical protein [Edaphocola sp.]